MSSSVLRISLFLSLLSLVVFVKAPAAHAGAHRVAPGETLWRIARANGCGVDSVRRANQLSGNTIRPGQTLSIPKCDGKRQVVGKSRTRQRQARVAAMLAPRGRRGRGQIHQVRAGDTLYGLARKYKTSVSAIRASNRISGNLIRPGSSLRIPFTVGGSSGARITRRVLPRGEGQSFGWPSAGRLFEGTQLPAHDAYHRRRPDLAWGTARMVAHLHHAIESTYNEFPELHRLSIGDISSPRGGRIKRHVSHQSGRDVDIGFYFRNAPNMVPRSFADATKENLHFEATWQLITTLLETRDMDGGLQMIFLSYELQELLYKYALRTGVSQTEVDELFQYPAPPHTARGVIRHEPGHENHLHARFRCPSSDTGCR